MYPEFTSSARTAPAIVARLMLTVVPSVMTVPCGSSPSRVATSSAWASSSAVSNADWNSGDVTILSATFCTRASTAPPSEAATSRSRPLTSSGAASSSMASPTLGATRSSITAPVTWSASCVETNACTSGCEATGPTRDTNDSVSVTVRAVQVATTATGTSNPARTSRVMARMRREREPMARSSQSVRISSGGWETSAATGGARPARGGGTASTSPFSLPSPPASRCVARGATSSATSSSV